MNCRVVAILIQLALHYFSEKTRETSDTLWVDKDRREPGEPDPKTGFGEINLIDVQMLGPGLHHQLRFTVQGLRARNASLSVL